MITSFSKKDISNSNSLNNIIKNESSPLEKKVKKYVRKIPINVNKTEQEKIIETVMKEFYENFQDILIKSKRRFLKSIIKEVDLILSEIYQNKPLENQQIKEYQQTGFEKLEEEYDKNYNILKKEWQNYMKYPNKYNYLSHFRKHCIHTNNEAYHPCETEKAKLIEIKDINNNILYIICTECKQCYKPDSISLLCYYCKVEYFSCILPPETNENILPATWEKYHCGRMINETMKCIKCQNILYYDLTEKYLICLNKKCNFKAKPENMIWNCIFCKKDFKSDIKIYNPLEIYMIKRAIKKALLFKEPSYPNELPCCKVNPEELIFYHKESCKGELYKGILNRQEINVCSKCRAMNFIDIFIWICPLCHKRFRNYKSVWGKLFKKKEYLIEDEGNFNNEKNGRYNNYDDDDNDNMNQFKYNERLNTSSSLHFSKNNLSKFEGIRNISSYDKLNNLITENNENQRKKKQYKTLLDLIEERNRSSNKEDRKFSYNNLLLSQNDKNILENSIETPNIYSTNEGSLSGNSNQTSNKIKKLNVNLSDNFEKIKHKKTNSKSLNEDESSQSSINIINEKDSINSTSRKSDDKINILDNFENNNKKKNLQIETSFEKKDSLSSIGELASIASFTPSNLNNILTSPEKINSIIKEGKIPEFNIDDYIYLNPIGEGSFGKIYLVQNSYDKSKYALKKIICHDIFEVKQYQNEIELFYSKPHPNIMKIIKVQYKALDITTYSIYILMELAISDWNSEIKMRQKKQLLYSEKEIINILNQITDACLYLEKEGIAHRDIKPQNILLFEKNIFKIADFGEAKSLNDTSQECTLRGSELYMSPILYNGLKINQKDVIHNAYKSDVFSLAFCILYGLTLNLKILNELRNIINMNIISNIVTRTLKQYYSSNLINLILNMLQLNEKDRFSFFDVKNYLNEKYN